MICSCRLIQRVSSLAARPGRAPPPSTPKMAWFDETVKSATGLQGTLDACGAACFFARAHP